MQISSLQRVRLAIVCLAFTGADVAWADDGTPATDQIVPAPHPHADYGSTVRLGTAAGFIYGAPVDVTAIGVTAAVGQRFGRLGIDAEYTWLSFQSHELHQGPIGLEDGDVGVGSGKRLAVLARFDALRFGPVVDRRRSLLTIYVEGGAASSWNHWTRPTSTDSTIVPADTRRTEGQAGFGLMLFPHRVAWLIGWRFAVTPHEPMTAAVCRGTSCKPYTMTDDGSYVDQSMLFESSLEFTF